MSKKLLKEKTESLVEKSKVVAGYMEKAGKEIDLTKVDMPGCTDTMSKVRKLRELNAEMSDIGKEVDDLKAVHEIPDQLKTHAERMKTPVTQMTHGGGKASGEQHGRAPIKGFGDMFVESAEYKKGLGSYRNNEFEIGEKSSKEDAEVGQSGLKTLVETAAGWAPETTRIGRVIDIATREIQVIDAIPAGQTGQAAIVYMEETLFTNAAAGVAEGGTMPESALKVEEKTSPVKKIATWLPVTDEQLEDVAQARSYLNNRLPFMLRQELDEQILTGDGVGANLTGILNTAGIQTQAKGIDPIPDAVFKAMTAVRVTGRALPDTVMLHPNDWQRVRLLRTADGIYIWGSPAEAGPERMWGRSVIQTDVLTEGEGLVGDFRNFVQLFERRGVTVMVSNSHGTFFIKGKQAIRADLRAALTVFRPAAFNKLTGLNT